MANTKRLQNISFLIVLGLVFVLVLFMFKSFVSLIAFALILSIILRPIYRFFLRHFQFSSLSAIATLIVLVIVVSLPLALFGQAIISSLNDVYDRYKDGAFVLDTQQLIDQVPNELKDVIKNFSQDINNFIGNIVNDIFSSTTKIVSNIAGFFVSLTLLLFVLYYLLKDGAAIKRAVKDLSPSETQEDKLFEKIVLSVNGVVKGSFLVAVLQGFVATIGYYIVGMPEPLIWGGFTIIASLVPNFGTSLALIPAIGWLIITGNITGAIILAIWGALIVGTIDNFIRPYLVGSAVKLHPVLVLLSVIGGLELFGLLGFLVRPIVMAIFVALVDIYREEFSTYFKTK